MLPRSLTIRQATEADAPALVKIYAPYVESTAVSFETLVPSVEDFAARIAKSLSKWQYLVAESDGRIAGYAYGSTHRERAAYRYSVEVSAYLDPRFYRQGIGTYVVYGGCSTISSRKVIARRSRASRCRMTRA